MSHKSHLVTEKALTWQLADIRKHSTVQRKGAKESQSCGSFPLKQVILRVDDQSKTKLMQTNVSFSSKAQPSN